MLLYQLGTNNIAYVGCSLALLLGLRTESSSPEEAEDDEHNGGDEGEESSSARFLLSSWIFGPRIFCITYDGRSFRRTCLTTNSKPGLQNLYV